MSATRLRGVRGATTVEQNTDHEIVTATRDLLAEMTRVNGIDVTEVASCFFSVTRDLNANFPAQAARALGWVNTPLLCMHEMDVPTGLAQCIRILLHVNTTKSQVEMRHVYLRGAKVLRPDLESIDEEGTKKP